MKLKKLNQKHINELLHLYDEVIESSKFKKSEVRKEVFKALIESQTHLNAEQLHRYINQDLNQKVGIATIYRSLNFLEEANLISSVMMNKMNYFEPKVSEHHDHLICDECGKVVEFLDDVIESRQEKIAKKYGFKLSDHSLVLNGICKNCQK